jgi:hypothetical protein
MNSARKGNTKELASARIFEAAGALVGSRRHVGGAGDLLVVWAPNTRSTSACGIWLVEVKARHHVWQGFRRPDRLALRDAARSVGAVAVLAWWKPGDQFHTLLYEDEWPA